MRRRSYKTRRPFRRLRRIFRRRRYGRRRNTRASRIRTRSVGFLLPDRLKVKLRWQATETLTFDDQGLVVTNYLGNGPYDPDGDGSFTHQPTGWDQYCALYKEYYCSGSSMKVTAINNSGDAVDGGNIFGVYPAIDPINTTDMLTIAPVGYPYCTEKFLNILNGPGGLVTIKKYMPCKKIYGKRTSTDPTFFGTAGSQALGTNPTALWWWNFYASARQGSEAEGKSITLRITITYYIQFCIRREIPRS